MMRIRRAEPRDDAAIGELLVTAFESAYAVKMPEVVYSDARRQDLRDVAAKRVEGVVLVAEEDGAVLGTVLVYPPGAPKSEAWLPNTADLRQLAVLPARFGQGLSGVLMDEVEAIAWAMGVDAISLHTRRGANGVGRLYEGRGYVRAPAGDMTLPEVDLVAYVLRRPL